MNTPHRTPSRPSAHATLFVMTAAVAAAGWLAAAPDAQAAEAEPPVQRVVVVGKRLPAQAAAASAPSASKAEVPVPAPVQRVEVVGRRPLATAKASEALVSRLN